MKRVVITILSLTISFCAYSESTFFVSKPSLTPDGKTIYFSYSGDIYKVARDGGLALAVVSMKGNENNPRISPDGKYLTFSSDEEGNNNVYIVPTDGGEIRQLTFSDANDIPVSWSGDSRLIFMESNRYNNISTYSISIEGGTPVRLFDNYFNTISNLVQNPVSKEFLFNESAESYSFPTRKGYKGDHNPNIISYNKQTKEYKELTDYVGKDTWPMVDKNGVLYYVSDEKNGQSNIVKPEAGEKVWLTNFDESIQYPSISFDGSAIVFIKGYKINILDIKTKKTFEPEIKVANDLSVSSISIIIERPAGAALSPDGKKLAFIFRGLIFVSDAKGNLVKEIPTPGDERVAEVIWSDNNNIYYTRTNKGWTNIFKQKADGGGEEAPVYMAESNIKNLTISNNRKKIVFISGSTSIMLLDLTDNKVSEIAKQEFWSFQNYQLSFSSDDKYLTYSAMNMFERDLFVYCFEKKNLINLTNSANIEDSPVFSTDGKYIYFVANRYNASFPRGAQQKLYRVSLDKIDTQFGSQEFSKLFESKTPKGDSTININLEDFQRRYESLLPGGSQYNPFILSLKDKSYLLFVSDHEGENGVYVQEIKEWDQKPAQKIKGLTGANSYITNGKDLFILERSGLFKVDVSSLAATKIEIKHSFSKSVKDEFSQMFYETWALLEQNFYDVSFHGVNWKKIRDSYAAYIPYIKNRSELRTLIADMLGELNSSHLGFSSSGKEEDTPFKMISSEAGLLFDNENPYSLTGIVKGSKADFSANPLKSGDELTKVNGKNVDKSRSRESYFVSPNKQEEVSMTFLREGKEIEVKLHTNTTSEIKTLLYTDWEDQNRDLTEKLSKGKFAYIHMRDMSEGALNNFLIEMNTNAVHKDGLILDLRYNNGGNVHKEVIDFLRQKQYFKWSYRDKQKVSHPNVTPANWPIIVLINERSLSDAEVTSNGIKELQIAKIVGTESYRWIIFTSAASLVDGSFCRLPAWGCYTLDGKDMEKTGVAPDIYVKNTFKDRIDSKDPQLERAIKELLSL